MTLGAAGWLGVPQHAGRDTHAQVQAGHVVLLGVALNGVHQGQQVAQQQGVFLGQAGYHPN